MSFKTLRLLFLILLVVISIGCVRSDIGNKETLDLIEPLKISKKVDSEARKLLIKYSLNPIEKPRLVKFALNNDHGFYSFVRGVSSSIGYNIEPFKGKQVTALKYLLKQKSQGINGNIYGFVLFDKDNIIGAYASLEGYAPGLVALNDKAQFAPERLKSHELVFDEISKIELTGPWNDDDEKNPWTKQVVITDENDISYITSLLTKSQRFIRRI